MQHEMKLQPIYFDFILHGTKRIELRLYDEKRRKIKIGDTIRFLKEPELTDFFVGKVVHLYHYSSFDEILDQFDSSILADKTITKEKLKKDLETFYPKEMQKQYGVVGIHLELIQ